MAVSSMVKEIRATRYPSHMINREFIDEKNDLAINRDQRHLFHQRFQQRIMHTNRMPFSVGSGVRDHIPTISILLGTSLAPR